MLIRLLSAIAQIAFWILLFRYINVSQGTAFFFGVFACMLDNFVNKMIDAYKDGVEWDRRNYK